MSDRNWEAEMAKIDKQLASVSDDKLVTDRKPVPAGRVAPASVAPPAARVATGPSVPSEGGSWRSWLKVVIAVTAAGGLMFWPWPARCGLPLVGFTVATGGVALLGLWSAFGTWRHRLGLAHMASLLVMLWGVGLGAREILPRIGYAIPSLERPGQWSCEGLFPLPVQTPPVLPGIPNTNPVPGVQPPTTSPTSSPPVTLPNTSGA